MPAPALGLTARAIVDRVIDGDTVDVHIVIPVRVRLLNCWAPEITGVDKIAGHEAKAAMEKLLPVGTMVHVNVPTQAVDALGGVMTFGRVLGEIYVVGDDESVSQLMVGMGHATQAKHES
jgi:endonuclease YncB( thermonuclease family)